MTLTTVKKSLSVRECGLKGYRTYGLFLHHPSLSVRECGLKGYRTYGLFLHHPSLSVRECGLKGYRTYGLFLHHPSLSVRECGLKGLSNMSQPRAPRVTLRARVWIESTKDLLNSAAYTCHSPCESVD